MTVLQFGLTPKARPVSPKRSALVAALALRDRLGWDAVELLIAPYREMLGRCRLTPRRPGSLAARPGPP